MQPVPKPQLPAVVKAPGAQLYVNQHHTTIRVVTKQYQPFSLNAVITNHDALGIAQYAATRLRQRLWVYYTALTMLTLAVVITPQLITVFTSPWVPSHMLSFLGLIAVTLYAIFGTTPPTLRIPGVPVIYEEHRPLVEHLTKDDAATIHTRLTHSSLNIPVDQYVRSYLIQPQYDTVLSDITHKITAS